MNSGSVPAYASFQYVGDTQRITDLPQVLFTAILHHAGAADHFEVGHLCQLGQNVILHAISKKRMLFVVAKVFKWEHRDPSRQWMPCEISFRNDPSRRCRESNKRPC